VFGIEAPLVNTQLHGIEVDMHWPGDDVVVEVDGSGHERERTKNYDAARDERLKARGFEIVRVKRA
jgi:very-short-patch-repair endonuclease